MRHDNVLAKVRNLNCSPDFRALNFKGSKYEGENGRSQPCFEMTRDGFTRLVMSFTGEKAAGGRQRLGHSVSVNCRQWPQTMPCISMTYKIAQRFPICSNRLRGKMIADRPLLAISRYFPKVCRENKCTKIVN
jgi:hypothetical protein